MMIVFARALRCAVFAVVLVTTLCASVLASAGTRERSVRVVAAAPRTALVREPRGHYASTPTVLHAEGGDLLAFPPSLASSTTRRPLSVVYLHGAHGRAANGCPAFRSGTSELGWLVCPEAIEPQPDGSWSWGADVFLQRPVVAHALAAAVANGASAEPGIAVGFSQGSYVALDLVNARLASFRGLVLLSAELHPNVATLRNAGVRRVALGAGQLDATYASLKDEAIRMENEGLEARFFDLGRIGHTYLVDDSTVLHDAITWAASQD